MYILVQPCSKIELIIDKFCNSNCLCDQSLTSKMTGWGVVCDQSHTSKMTGQGVVCDWSGDGL